MILLLPERRRFPATTPALATLLGRADRLGVGEPGERAQLQRHFEILPRAWPMAAITRQHDAGDAGERTWLRADPVFVQAEMAGARLNSWGKLGLDAAEAEDFLALLRPVFGEAGMVLDAPAPERWYLSLPPGAPLPEFPEPAESLGGDLLSLLPQGPEGRRWRALFNEAQVLLHQHPRNAQRAAAGRATVNALWFWGAGRLPHSVRAQASSVMAQDVELEALARLAGLAPAQETARDALVDLRPLRDAQRLETLLGDALREGLEPLLDFADGVRLRLRRSQRWRFWRKAFSFQD
jgi:hypothetical protein